MWRRPGTSLLAVILGSVLPCLQPSAATGTAVEAKTVNGTAVAQKAPAGPTLSIALSRDGNTIAMGAPGESSSAVGIGGSQENSAAAAGSGAVHVFIRRGGTWSQQAYVKASNTSAGDAFGISVSLSSDGNTLAVGAYLEDSPGTGINGNQGGIADNNANAGAVYVFTRNRDAWSQQAYVKASNTHSNAYFGHAVSLNGDGNTLAVGAAGENTGGLNSGAAYVFTRSASVWSQQARVKACNTVPAGGFGSFVALSGDGNTLEVGGGAGAAADGLKGRQAADGTGKAGPVHVFARNTGTWLATGQCERVQPQR
jgi:hypothetical protein